jgi:carboxypeptidase C (cathepsin A)
MRFPPTPRLRRDRLFLAVAAVVALTSVAPAQQAATFHEPTLATTSQSVRVNGSTLSYTARVGLIPIRHNDTGEVRGHFGFVSYALDRAPGQAPRPVIFLWNGGPGSDSTTVHFTGFGPRRIRTPDDPAHPTPVTTELYDNEATWLTFADLVFVDPVGTGFARPTKAEYSADFYNTLGDIASTAEFIRTFRTRFDLFASPIFLAGESYGTWRAAGAAEILEQRGIRVAGVILISGGLAMGQAAPDAIRTALFVPARTATAFYHKALAPELLRDEAQTLKEAQAWALDTYAPAWEQRASLGDADRDRIVAGLAKYTGIPAAGIDRANLSMTSPQFTSTLLKDRGVTLGRYDMRILQGAGAGGGGAAVGAASGPWRSAIILRYLRDDLGFKTDLTYQGQESGWSPAPSGRGGGPGSRWVWNQGESPLASGTDAARGANRAAVGSGDGPPGGSQPWIRRAMALNPRLRLFVAAGQYDSLNSCADNTWTVAHLDAAVTRRVTLGCYAGGHMMYDTKPARAKLKEDVAAFSADDIQKAINIRQVVVDRR